MRNDRKRIVAAAAVFTLALGGAAIGGMVAGAQVKVPTVTVSLKEFKIAPAAKLTTGKVTLNVVNKGKMSHALAVSGPGVNAKTAMLAAGKSAKLTVTFKDGSYNLWCPVGNHASLGMKLTAKLGTTTAGGAAGGTTGGTNTTGAGAGGDGSTAGGEWG